MSTKWIKYVTNTHITHNQPHMITNKDTTRSKNNYNTGKKDSRLISYYPVRNQIRGEATSYDEGFQKILRLDEEEVTLRT